VLALAGILLGLAAQFRPNMILMPLVLAAFLMVARRIPGRTLKRLRSPGVFGIGAAALDRRNARLTGELIPASTHGGLQLWYGTLQTGPYLKSRAYNPRRVFEAGSFPYTSLDSSSARGDGTARACVGSAPAFADARVLDRSESRAHPGCSPVRPNRVLTRPGWRRCRPPTTYYFYLEARWPEATLSRVPEGGDRAPLCISSARIISAISIVFGDLLDVFDLVRLLRHGRVEASRTPASDHVDFDGGRRLTAC